MASRRPIGGRRCSVLEQLGRDAAQAKQDGGAKLGVAVEAQDQLGAALDQLLDQEAFDLLVGGALDRGRHRLAATGYFLRLHVHGDAADLRLVEDVPREDLEDDRAAELSGRLLGRGRGGDHLPGDGDAEAREQRLALRLVERSGAEIG